MILVSMQADPIVCVSNHKNLCSAKWSHPLHIMSNPTTITFNKVKCTFSFHGLMVNNTNCVRNTYWEWEASPWSLYQLENVQGIRQRYPSQCQQSHSLCCMLNYQVASRYFVIVYHFVYRYFLSNSSYCFSPKLRLKLIYN